jgi:cellulose synthase/poly-beta-1,6-N-acetylglucosamine synthase-like glycosyltransferase
VYEYIEHTHEMSRVNGATDALIIGPSAGYNMFFVFAHILLLFTAYVSSDTHMHIHDVTYITVIFWIKLKLKMTISLTITMLNLPFCCVIISLRWYA